MVSSEFGIATGQSHMPWCVDYSAKNNNGIVALQCKVFKWNSEGVETRFAGNSRTLPCLKGFRKKPKVKGIYAKSFNFSPNMTLYEQVHDQIVTDYLVYLNDNVPCICTTQNSSLPMSQEFAIALAYFHLSSVCRYNPESVDKLKSSKGWPMLLALRRHGLYHFMLTCLLYTSPSPRDLSTSRMPSSA